ncbi:MAG TPA: hypothetical protein VLJ61_11125 [Pyrinomonadaceae bacterium]|nr:hypothetical protein [Pyrinomonadaceae bacterium]
MTDASEQPGDGEAQARSAEVEGGDDSLEAAARGEREYARERLSAELGRKPSESEVDEWLNEQTEGY